MNKPQQNKENFIFSTEVSSSSNEEFHLEFYESNDLKCEGVPVKVTRDFDDLIDFFEKLDN